jgi:peptide/nickel transport system permease protein
MGAVVVFAGFLSPYDSETQNRSFAFAPPTRIRFVDHEERFHLRPFVYELRSRGGSLHGYEEDGSIPYPLQFFTQGASYRILGYFPLSLHLFAVNSGGHVFLLGTDPLGRDVLSRLLYGGQISLLAALLATSLSVGLGFLVGGLAGYYGGWTDEILMRIAEVFLSMPWIYVLLAIRAVLPLHLEPASVFLLIMFAAGSVGWSRPARLIRGIVLSAREREYILAARGFGASDFYILRTHVLPQALVVALTQASLYLPQYITAEVTLSFFGLGVSEPAPSWGNMLAQLRSLFVLETCWWMFAPAALLIFVLGIFQWFFRTELNRRQSSVS